MMTKKLKIAFVLDDGMDRQAGVQQYILMLGKWFVSNGHEVHYLVGATENKDLVPNIHVMSRNFHTQFNGNRVSTPLPASRRKIKQLLEREQFDVIHVQVPYSPFMAATVMKCAPKTTPIIGTFHIMPYTRLQGWSNQLLSLALRPTARRFNRIFAVSAAAQAFAKNVYRMDSIVLPNPVDYEAFHTRHTKKKNRHDFVRLLFVGRLVKRKGCAELLQALAAAHKRKLLTEKWHLDILSDGPDRQRLEQYVKDNRIHRHVTFYGYVSETEKIAFLQNADIAVFPALGGESFGIVLTEALAAGSPVVLGGDNPGYRSVLGEFPESLFDPHDTDSLAATLAQYITDAGARSSLYTKQQTVGDRYDVKRIGKELLETYKRCNVELNKHNRG